MLAAPLLSLGGSIVAMLLAFAAVLLVSYAFALGNFGMLLATVIPVVGIGAFVFAFRRLY